MLDVAPSEFLLVAVVALLVIGPKDLPKALRVLGHWVGRARGVARQFRSGFDNMVREAELAELEKKWAAENARILAEHPAEAPSNTPEAAAAGLTPPVDDAVAPPVLVVQPVVAPAPADHAPADHAPAADGKAPS
jgi:sec-independent protein translocase protein TatB